MPFQGGYLLFLGHVVSLQGIHTDPKMLKAVSQFSIPHNVQGVHSYLGVAGNCRHFVFPQSFPHLLHPFIMIATHH